MTHHITLYHIVEGCSSADLALEQVLRNPTEHLSQVTVQDGEGKTLYFAPSNIEGALRTIARQENDE